MKKPYRIEHESKSLSLCAGLIYIEQINEEPDVFIIETQEELREDVLEEYISRHLELGPVQFFEKQRRRPYATSRGLFLHQVNPCRWIGIRDWA